MKPIDADEAKRLIQVLNNATAAATSSNTNTNTSSGNTSSSSMEPVDPKDLTAVLQILNRSSESTGGGSSVESAEQELSDVEISRFKQIALSALRYSLALSFQEHNNSTSNINGSGSGSGSGITAKRIILDGLLPLTNLPTWIESFILSAIDVLVEHVVQRQNSTSLTPVSTIGIEFLLVPYIARIHPDQAKPLIYTICCCNNDDVPPDQDQDQTVLNPHCAAAISASLSEMHNLSSLLTPQHLSSLTRVLLHSLRTFAKMKEYESIPPIIYQLCGLTKLSFGTKNAYTFNSGGGNSGGGGGLSFLGSSKEMELSYRILYGVANFLSSLGGEEEQVRWTICTSLSHLGRMLRNNPSLPNVLLQIIKGKKAHLMHQNQRDGGDGDGVVGAMRYTRMTPMLLALGLTMASSIPRMKMSLLEAVRDLVLEEEMVRCKRFTSRYVNSIVALMDSGQRVDEEGNIVLRGEEDVLGSMVQDLKHYVGRDDVTSQMESGLEERSHMMKCMKSLVLLAEGGKEGGGSASDAEFSTLFPTLISLGFMLIDSVKKDLVVETSGNTSAYCLPPIPNCASELAGNSINAVQQQANANVAKIGRSLLVYLFIRAGGSPDDEGVVTVSGFSTSMASPQCRIILQMACEKFCGMAPNALEHSFFLKDLARDQSQGDSGNATNISVGLGAHILEETFVPMIIDLLANIPGGGMPPLVARRTIIPVLDTLLKISAGKARRSRRKRNVLNDHIDHCFLLAKKALFCTDIERRKVAVNLLVAIIGVAVELSDDSSALLDEVKGYLRRCMTQHQGPVRLEVYSSLVALIPDSQDSGDLSQSQSQDVVEGDRGCKREPLVSQILLQHLERYIAIEEDATILEARRKRAIAHGTHLSQQMDIDAEDCNHEDNFVPIRIDLCISSGRATSKGRQLSDKRSKKKAKSPDLLTEAVDRISEPISFLLGASLAVVEGSMNESNPASVTMDLHTTLIRLRTKMAATDLENCMKWCEGSKIYKIPAHEHYVRMLSTCLLVASICETLMGAPSRSNDNGLEEIGKLFRLRSDAIYKAAAIITSAKANQSIKKKKATKKQKTDDDADENDTKEAVNDDVLMIGSSSDVNRKALHKAKVSVEERICTLSPAMRASFLNETLREYGILGQKKSNDDVLHATQDDDEGVSVKTKLTSNESFRRFLLDKCVHLVSGTALMIKVGHRFDIQCQGDTARKFIAPVFMLAPVLLAEFVSHVQSRVCTSLEIQEGTPLSLLALSGFVSCAQRLISSHTPKMSSQMKICSLIRSSISTVSNHFPSFKENWNSRKISVNLLGSVPNEEKDLLVMLFPFVMPMECADAQPTRANSGLLTEVLSQGLDVEASKICELIKCIGSHLTVHSRQLLSLFTMESFRVIDSVEVIQGVVGLDLGSDGDCSQCASAAIDTAIFLDGLIDGSTELPQISGIALDEWRRDCGFCASKPEDLEKITGRRFKDSEFNSLGGDNLVGVLQLVASSLQATNPIGTNFVDFVDSKASLFHFACTDVVSAKLASSELVSKDLSIASTSILAALEYGIADVEFLTNKILPHLIGTQIVLVQRFVGKLCSSVGKIICTTCFCSNACDDDGHFMSTLLKCCKRLYASYTKLLGYLPEHLRSVANDENSVFLFLMKNKLHMRTMALLLTLSEKCKVGNKALADSKISSHGRIAEQVVFELERCHNALLKLSAKLKTAGFETESNFVLDNVGSGTKVRGFKIKENEIKEIRERAELGNASKKRKKVKSEGTTKKASKRKKGKTRKESDDDNESQGTEGNSTIGDTHSISEDASDNGSEDNQSKVDTFDVDKGDESDNDGDSIVGKFVINSASEDSDSEEDEDETEDEDEL